MYVSRCLSRKNAVVDLKLPIDAIHAQQRVIGRELENVDIRVESIASNNRLAISFSYFQEKKNHRRAWVEAGKGVVLFAYVCCWCIVVGLPIPSDHPLICFRPIWRVTSQPTTKKNPSLISLLSDPTPSSSFLFHIISCIIMHIPIIPSHQTQQQTHRHVTYLSRFWRNSKRETHHTNSRITNHISQVPKAIKSRG